VALYDRDAGVARRSLERGAGDRVLDRADEALGFDGVVLAMPVPEIVSWLDRHGPRCPAGLLVLDTGSVKRCVVETMGRAMPAGVRAMGGHPIAGTERTGPEGADPGLIRGAAFVLCPARDDQNAMRAAAQLVEAMGARPMVMDAADHDRAVARTSHLPHLVASALALAAGDVPGERPLVAGPGWRSATRLAVSDPDVVAAFVEANADEVLQAAAAFGSRLQTLLDAVRRGAVRQLLASAGETLERLG
jgi:prephenate dehydrogenase